MGLKDAAIGSSQESSQESAIGSQESEVVDPTPPEEWMVEQRLAAKRAEEKMAAGCDAELFVAKRPRAARQIVMKEAEAAEEVKSVATPAVAEKKKKKKTRVVRLDQGLIDHLLQQQPMPPFKRVPDEVLNRLPDPAMRDQIRADQDRAAAAVQEDIDFCTAILEQYHAKGYAEIVDEVDSDTEAEYMAQLKAGKFG